MNTHGPTIHGDGATFRVWAPEHDAVELVLVDSNGHEQRKASLARDKSGFFSARIAHVSDGSLYFYRFDGDQQNYPDPASHFQPQGVFGPSQVIDHRRFTWTDGNWRGAQLPSQIIYELHLGTFTSEGTWRSAAEKLPRLR
ncbi:MAG TPA: malto-oligosyltrehalose trehalohydrolase, partial [Lacipirellulaceae bacterium]|nr:malto-oligosyltrehalose trehalohydrolase [Lacipirellulaceae bacterium]